MFTQNRIGRHQSFKKTQLPLYFQALAETTGSQRESHLMEVCQKFSVEAGGKFSLTNLASFNDNLYPVHWGQ